MNNVLLGEERQSLQDLDAKPKDEFHRNPREVEFPQELIQVLMQQFEHQARVSSKKERVFHVNDVALAPWVLHQHLLQDPYFHFGLGAKLGFIPDYFEGHGLLTFVIVGLEDLAKRPLAQDIEYFISIDDGVVCGHLGVTAGAGEIFGCVDPPLSHK